MSYKKADHILPNELVKLIQEYIDGEYLYIPKKEGHKKSWGTDTSTRNELEQRNTDIYKDYLLGIKPGELEKKYFLSSKSIQRIILCKKRAKKTEQ